MIETIVLGIIGLVTLVLIVLRVRHLYHSLRHPAPNCTACEGCHLRESCAKNTPQK